MNTFNSFCIAACVFMIFVGMATVVVTSLGVFPSTTSIDTSESQSKYDVTSITVWSSGITIGSILTAGISLLTRSTNLMGICIFGTIFWTSWLSLIPIFNTGGFLNNTTGVALIAMITFGMTIMFIGAVIGMLTGRTEMK